MRIQQVGSSTRAPWLARKTREALQAGRSLVWTGRRGSHKVMREAVGILAAGEGLGPAKVMALKAGDGRTVYLWSHDGRFRIQDLPVIG